MACNIQGRSLDLPSIYALGQRRRCKGARGAPPPPKKKIEYKNSSLNIVLPIAEIRIGVGKEICIRPYKHICKLLTLSFLFVVRQPF